MRKTNLEKYYADIKDALSPYTDKANIDTMGYNVKENRVQLCGVGSTLDCVDCLFYKYHGDCEEAWIKWLLSDSDVFLSRKEFDYICHLKTGYLFRSAEEPNFLYWCEFRPGGSYSSGWIIDKGCDYMYFDDFGRFGFIQEDYIFNISDYLKEHMDD